MSKYYKAEDVQELITACIWRMTLAKERGGEGFVEYDKDIVDVGELRKRLSNLPIIEVSEDNQVLYGTAHNCILTMFGECSYNETGCSDCAVAEKIRKALSAEVSEDAISRANLLSELRRDAERVEMEEFANDTVWRTIGNAPSVIPKPKEGEWISKHNGYWTCSECGLSFLFYAKGNYCPNCGCAMGKENE